MKLPVTRKQLIEFLRERHDAHALTSAKGWLARKRGPFRGCAVGVLMQEVAPDRAGALDVQRAVTKIVYYGFNNYGFAGSRVDVHSSAAITEHIEKRNYLAALSCCFETAYRGVNTSTEIQREDFEKRYEECFTLMSSLINERFPKVFAIDLDGAFSSIRNPFAKMKDKKKKKA